MAWYHWIAAYLIIIPCFIVAVTIHFLSIWYILLAVCCVFGGVLIIKYAPRNEEF